jgi:hypothetical protein
MCCWVPSTARLLTFGDLPADRSRDGILMQSDLAPAYLSHLCMQINGAIRSVALQQGLPLIDCEMHVAGYTAKQVGD